MHGRDVLDLRMYMMMPVHTFCACSEALFWPARPSYNVHIRSIIILLLINPSPAEPGYALPFKQCRS